MGGPRLRLSLRANRPEERVKISEDIAARTRRTLWPCKEPASRPRSHVRISLSPDRIPRHFSPTFARPLASLPAARADGEAQRRTNTGRPRLILDANNWDYPGTLSPLDVKDIPEETRSRCVGAKPPVYLQDRATRFGHRWINCRTVVSRRVYVARGLNRDRHENGSLQRNELGLTMMGLYPLLSESLDNSAPDNHHDEIARGKKAD